MTLSGNSESTKSLFLQIANLRLRLSVAAAEFSRSRKHLEKPVDEKAMDLQAANEHLRMINEELSAKKAQFEAIFDSMPESVIFADANRKIVMCNPAAERLFGYAHDELAGAGTECLYIDRSDYDRLGKEYYNREAGRELKPIEIRCKRKDGTVFRGETLAANIVSPLGVTGFVEIHRDITERRQAENDLRRTRDALEAANKELEAFAYSVSHDLRAPLRFIEGFSRAIEGQEAARLSDAGKDYFRRVQAAAKKMAQLIEALLNLSRLTRGELNRSPVDLSSMAKAVADELRRSEPGRQVEFVVMGGMTAEGDPVMLRVVIDNLIGNAWKFTGKKERARIEFGVVKRDGQDVYFVRDNGAGFDATYENRLFMAFQRLHPSSEFPGLGIGLATVKRIVNRHGGRIWAESEVDKGTTFYFTLA